MKKHLPILLNAIGLLGLIVYWSVVTNRINNLKGQYQSVYNEYKELDKKYSSKLYNITVEIEKDLNSPTLRDLPDSIRLKLVDQRRFGAYFSDYIGNNERIFELLKIGLEQQLSTTRTLAIIGLLSFLVNAFYIFFRNRH